MGRATSGVAGGDLLKTKEAAELIGITRAGFRYHAQHGRIVASKTIRIGKYTIPLYSRRDVQRLAESIRVDGVRGRGRPRNTDAKE